MSRRERPKPRFGEILPPDPIAQAWKKFVELSMPPDAPPDQHRKMRIAFFCGAMTLYQIVAVDLPDQPDEVGLEWMTLLGREIDRFCLEIGAAMPGGKP